MLKTKIRTLTLLLVRTPVGVLAWRKGWPRRRLVVTLKNGFYNLKTDLFAYLDKKNLPMGLCVAGDVHQGAFPHRAAPSRSCRGGFAAVAVQLLSPDADAQSPRSSTRWGTPL